MADIAISPSVLPGPTDRQRAIMDLNLAWNSVRATSAFVQQLDVFNAKPTVWGDAYANAQAILEATCNRLESWHGSPYPVEADQLEWTRWTAYESLRAVRRHVIAFEWHKAQAWLWGAGTVLLNMAHHMGVEL